MVYTRLTEPEVFTIILLIFSIQGLDVIPTFASGGPLTHLSYLLLASSFLPTPKLWSLTAIQCLTQSLILKFNSKFPSVKLSLPPHHLSPLPPPHLTGRSKMSSGGRPRLYQVVSTILVMPIQIRQDYPDYCLPAMLRLPIMLDPGQEAVQRLQPSGD